MFSRFTSNLFITALRQSNNSTRNMKKCSRRSFFMKFFIKTFA